MENRNNIPSDAEVKDTAAADTAPADGIDCKADDNLVCKFTAAVKRRWRDEWHPEKPPKKRFGKRSALEMIVASVPAMIMFAILLVVLVQMRTGDEPSDGLTMEYLAVAVTAVSTLLGIFCIRLGKAESWVILAIMPAVCFLLLEFFYHNPFDIKEGLFRINLALFYLIAALLVAFTGSIRWTIIIECGVTMLFGVANYFVMEFRGNPLFPWDFASVGTAATVADNFNYRITGHVALILCIFLLFIQFGILTTTRIRLKWWSVRVPALILSVLALNSTVSYVQSDVGVKELGMYPYLFTPVPVYTRNGAAVALAYTVQFADVQKPDGYSVSEVDSILCEYESDPVPEGQVLPNVIVVMNEAFSDLKSAVDYRENKPVTPYIDSMTEDTVKGTLHVSVKGGNTANTEFEFLTGLSMLHFTPGSIPYQQYMTGKTPSIASQLADIGYYTVGMHPYPATGWQRDQVYPWFGFEETYFMPDFKGYEKIRNYYSDRATYQKIIELYEAKDDSPMFVFDVTMQNHSGYTQTDNFTSQIFAYGMSSITSTNIYLSLMNESDKAFGELVDYFAAQDEPTIILMFGDHQPNDDIVTPLWKANGVTVEPGSLDEQLRRYTVPFVIWANYDIEEESDVHTSVNYLSTLLCEKAGLPLTAAQKYLSELSSEYPVVTMGHYGNSEGEYFDASTATSIPEFIDYSMLSYNLVADRERIIWEYFSYLK